ncbi:MAG: hypothetical protein V4685_08200 [Bacteroidota bacterium]
MLRIIFISVIVLAAGLLFLQGRLLERSNDKPVFLTTDKIADAHHTKIDVSVQSVYKPDSIQVETLKKDYSNLWAHLNHLFATNEVEKGKEYYTEPWFRQLCSHYKNVIELTGIVRKDVSHQLVIQNWSSDGLVCTAIDSSVVFKYTYPNKSSSSTKAKIAVVMLYQGDHWRIDAIKIIEELPAN